MIKSEKQLLHWFRELPEGDRATVLAFAEFLHAKAPRESVPDQPLDLPRPAEESVIAAIKRLSKTYPMLAKDAMLNQTSSLMSQHVLGGRSAREIIDELETLFRETYEAQRTTASEP